jgi:beta-glucosidase/6-phospho-beta-glucosidase/beta-galactosidase
MDYFGFNYYGAEWLASGGIAIDPAEEYSESGRAIDPRGLYDLLKEIGRRFPGLPVIVTENGISDSTDVLRPAYLLEHLAAIGKAKDEGVPVAGYYFWTLSDNLEWADGYCPKFGLVAVDRARRLRRVPRESFGLFRRIVATRLVTERMRSEAWDKVSAAAGSGRPFCRSDDGITPLDEPALRPFSAKDWRFAP